MFDEKILKQALEWLFLLQSARCSDTDRQRFDHWHQANSAHQAAYAEAQRLWAQFDQLKAATDLPELKKIRRSSRKNHGARALRIVGLFMVSAALITGGWMEYRAETLTYTTHLGEQRSFMLSDGSTVKLNTDTRLHVRISPLSRKLILEHGEALFDVQHEWLRSFIVETEALKIRDLGTRFNVKLQPEASTIAVLQGAVDINGQRLDEGFQLTFHANNSQIVQQVVDFEQVEAWQHGRLVFRRAPLRNVAAELERYHPVRFAFADPTLARETLSGSFASGDLTLFLEAVQEILPVSAQQIPQEKLILLDWASRKTKK